MIKAIIFDWGGVLIEDPTSAMIEYFSAALGVAGKAIKYAGDNLVLNFQKGMISEDDLWEEICLSLKVQKPSSPSLWHEAFQRSYQPRKEMFSLAARLKEQGYKVGLLSNTEIPSMKFFEAQQYEMFDVTIFSCVEGVSKPERRIYEIILEKLQVLSHEAVFIDDRKDFLEAAQRLGIHTIRFLRSDQTRAALENFLILP